MEAYYGKFNFGGKRRVGKGREREDREWRCLECQDFAVRVVELG